MTPVIERVLDPSAIGNGLAVLLGVFAPVIGLMPKGLHACLEILLDACLDFRARLLGDLMTGFLRDRSDIPPEIADRRVRDYVRHADRYCDYRMRLLGLMRRERWSSAMVICGILVALAGVVAGGLYTQARTAMAVCGWTGAALEVGAVLLARSTEDLYKSMRAYADFQGSA